MTKQHEDSQKNPVAEDLDEENIAENVSEKDEIAEEELPVEEQLERLKDENAKLKDSFLRAYAESENTKKRCQQEIEKNTKYAISSFAKELLTVADDLQRALSSVSEENKEACKSLLEGVELTQNELTHVFDKFGIKKIESLNKIFDPNLERVVQEVEDPEKPAGTVISELQSAYTINDRILREAMVIVTKGGPKN